MLEGRDGDQVVAPADRVELGQVVTDAGIVGIGLGQQARAQAQAVDDQAGLFVRRATASASANMPSPRPVSPLR